MSIQSILNQSMTRNTAKIDAVKGGAAKPVTELAIGNHVDSSDRPLASLTSEQALSELAMVLAREANGLAKQTNAAKFGTYYHYCRAYYIVQKIVKESGLPTAQVLTKLQSLTNTYKASL